MPIGAESQVEPPDVVDMETVRPVEMRVGPLVILVLLLLLGLIRIGRLAQCRKCRGTRVGLLFMIPGMNETLRVNGRVRLVRDADLLESMAYEGKLPKLAIVVDVEEVFSHCPKAFLRSKLWGDDYKIERSELPSFAEILRDHAALVDCDLDELQEELNHRAATTLH